MMLPRILALAVLAAVLLGACAVPMQGGPTDEEMESADYGPPPAQVEERVTRAVRRLYRDRSVVAVVSQKPRKAWYGQLGGFAERRDVRFGWSVRFQGYRLGVMSMGELAVEGKLFYRNDVLEGVADDRAFRFVTGNEDRG